MDLVDQKGPTIQELQAEKRSKRHMNLFDKVIKQCCCCVPMFVQNFMANQLKDGMPESAWFEDMEKLPKLLQYIISITFNLGFWSLFFVLFYQSYEQGRSSTFVSLYLDAGECEEVGRPTSGEFMVSTGTNGSSPSYAWSTSADFMFNSSAYMLSLNSYVATINEFNQQMINAGNALQLMGRQGRTRDLAWNLLAWSTFTYRNNSDDSGVFEFNAMGTPSIIFDRDMLMASISGPAGYCDAETSVEYSNGEYAITLVNYMNDQSCLAQLNPHYLMATQETAVSWEDMLCFCNVFFFACFVYTVFVCFLSSFLI